MELYVTGTANKKIAPDYIQIHFTFSAFDANYQTAYETGVGKVQRFVDEVLKPLGMQPKDLISTSLNVYMEREYDEALRRNVDKGYRYTQQAYLGFAYDMDRLSRVLDASRKLPEGPEYHISFSLKDERKGIDQAIALAMKEAEKNAKALAKSAKLKELHLKKVDLNHSGSHFRSNSDFAVEEAAVGGALLMRKNSLADTYTPEEITITQSVYCVYEGE